MTFPFDPTLGLVVTQAEIYGQASSQVIGVALDTGSARTIIDPATLVRVGYDLSNLKSSIKATTVSGQTRLSELEVIAVEALGQTVTNLEVVAHRLPSTNVDGVLGLDFLAGRVLTIDFVKSEITLTAPGPTP